MSKFAPRATKGMLVGQTEKGYLIFNPLESKISLSRNVKILENENYYQKEFSHEVTFFNKFVEDCESQEKPNTNSKLEIPSNYEEAINSSQSEEWLNAMSEEYQSLIDNNVFDEVDISSSRTIDAKWVFTVKLNSEGIPTRYKARLVARGFKQMQEVNYLENFAPVSEKSTIRVFLTMAAHKKHSVYHLDIKSAFLNGVLEEEVFILPPAPFKKQGKAWKVKKALYGLKQSPRIWNDHIVKLLEKRGFTQSRVDGCLFLKDDLYVLVYVDDILISTDNIEKYHDFLFALKSSLNIHELGEVRRFLGIEILKKNNGFYINQTDYIERLAEKYRIQQCKSVIKPLPSGIAGLDITDKCLDYPIQQLIGSLLFIANSTRPDILASVSLIARYATKPTKLLWTYAKQILKYLYSTRYESLVLAKRSDVLLETYADSDYGSDIATRKSQSGFVIKLFGSSVVWYSRKQSTISLSTTEAEYIALATAVSYTCGIKNLIEEFGLYIKNSIPIYEDNQPTIQIAQGSTKVKHLDIKLHFLKDLVKSRIIHLKYIPSEDQVADALTKAVPKISFSKIRVLLGLSENSHNMGKYVKDVVQSIN